jgi:predicted ATPase
LGEQLLGLSETIQDAGLSLEANLAHGNTLFLFGELIPALESMERALSIYDPKKHHIHAFLYGLDPGVFCLAKIAWIFALLGHPDQASKKIEGALTLAHQQSHAFSLAIAIMHACPIHILRSEWLALQQQAEAGIALCTEQGFASILAQSTNYRGYALARQGQTGEGIALMREGVAAARATGAGLYYPYHLAMLAEACGTAGHFEDGLTALAEAIAIVQRTEERVYEAKLHRLKGELTLNQSNVQGLQSNVQLEAEGCFRKSIEIARRQEAKSFELSAVTSLSRLWQKQGKKTEALKMLTQIYGWFSEGFDTPDLKDAKALLEQLSQDSAPTRNG